MEEMGFLWWSKVFALFYIGVMCFRYFNILAIASILFLGCSSPTVPCDEKCQEENSTPVQGPVINNTSKPNGGQFQCDGRIYCSEMTSCAEAKFFLNNCPGVKMDGGGDGVPCEKQWCH